MSLQGTKLQYLLSLPGSYYDAVYETCYLAGANVVWCLMLIFYDSNVARFLMLVFGGVNVVWCLMLFW